MNGSNRTSRDREIFVENFAAELTEAAYLAALRHGVAGSWVDLELDLWHALADTIRKREQEWAGRR